MKILPVLALLIVLGLSASAPAADTDVARVLLPIRDRYKLPAMGAAVLTDGKLRAVGVVGVRKLETDVPVTVSDRWHLGSDTKAMTAAMIGSLVQDGKLQWTTTMAQAFPDVKMPAQTGGITLLQLLTHRAGLPVKIDWDAVDGKLTLPQRRLAVVRMMAAAKLEPPGKRFLYTNIGYVIAAAMAEVRSGEAWEQLMQERLFRPLGMRHVGLGPMSRPDRVEQPWSHDESGQPRFADNTPIMSPAGRVHCPLSDWALFVAEELRGARDEKSLLKLEPQTWRVLQTAPFGGNYAPGWVVTTRPWGGGTVLTHDGSNTLNYSVAWLAPRRNFAVLVVTNMGGDKAAKACDGAAAALIGEYCPRADVP